MGRQSLVQAVVASTLILTCVAPVSADITSGLIDDVRVYGRALSEGEILWLAGKTVPVAKPF